MQKWKALKSTSECFIEGEFFKEGSSKADQARISIGIKMASVFKGEQCLYRQVAIESVQDRQNIFLENGCLFIATKKLTNEQIRILIPKSEGWLMSLDRFNLKTAATLLVILILLVIGYRYIFISVSSTIVYMFPYSWERQIGKATFDVLDKTLLEPSKLSSQKIDSITEGAANILNQVDLPFKPQIKFMKSDIIGPNALALPGGPIIITDALVKLLKDDKLILSVIAHEIAHVQQRHSLQQIVEIVGLSSLAWLVFGLDEGMLEEIALVGVNIWGLKKSRDFEKESDLIALELLDASGLEKNSFILAIEKLINHFCLKSKLDKTACLQDIESGWLSTHPSGAERLRYLREEIE